MRQAAVLLLLAPFALLAADESLPKAATILDHYVEATGGKAAYEKRHNEVQHGIVDFAANGIHGALTIYQAAPNKTLSVIEIEGVGKVESGSNGEIAWDRSVVQGARIKQGEERTDSLRDGTFNAPIHWQAIYAKTETIGSETVNGHDCYKVVLSPKEGKPVTQFYDKKSGLILKSMATRTTPMGDISAEIFLEDYRDEGGILMPHKLTNKVAMQQFLITVQSVEVNAELPKDRFDLPDEIKALLPKTEKPAASVPHGDTVSVVPADGGLKSGKLSVYMNGKPFASETYTIDKSTDKVQLDGSGSANLGTIKIEIEQFKVVADSDYHPLTATAKAKLGAIPMAVNTTFADGKAKSQINQGQGVKEKEDAVHLDAVVVNENLPLYPWSILAMRARFDTKDPQDFPVYIIGKAEVMGKAVYQGREPVEFAAGKTAELHHLTATGALPSGQPITLEFWLDDNHKIIKMTVPGQNVEAYQDGYDRKPQPPAAAPANNP
jgi:hypothetical protein